MEILDIVDEDGNPTGKTVDRKTAHENGILHRTSHLWLVRMRDGTDDFCTWCKNNTCDKEYLDKVEILIQKRSKNKDSHPGCYDISSAGHIPCGCGFTESAVRELKEELGVEAEEDELIYIGRRKFEYQEKFHDSLFHDNQISNVYMLWRNVPVSALRLQREEIEGAEWIGLMECIDKVKNNAIKHCIRPEELNMIKKEIEKEYERYSSNF